MLGVGLATIATAVGVPGAIDVDSVTGMPFATGKVGPGAGGLVVKAATTASWGNPEVWMKHGCNGIQDPTKENKPGDSK